MPRLPILAAPLALLLACADPAADPGPEPCTGKCDGADAGVHDGDGDGTAVCVALRGNGPRVTAHFTALARILEHYGTIDGVAGGSSGSVSAFFLESVQQNPAVRDSDDPGVRAAFLLKALRGYLEVLATSDEALAFAEVGQLAAAVRAGDIERLLAEDPAAGVAALRAILDSPDLRDLINPELLELLTTSPDPEHHARDLAATLSRGLSFTAEDPTIFVRPGAVDFPAFVERLGRIATFLAEADAGALLDACAAGAKGQPWPVAAAQPFGDTTCGDAVRALVLDWRARPSSARLDDRVGADLPALVTTGVLEGAAIDAWHAARADYLAGRPVTLDVDFADVGVGYWGDPADLALIEDAGAARTDLKSQKRRALGAATWRTVLAASPAEPGLSRGVELADGRVSVGGWSDLQPVLVLEDLGCDETLFVTREGGAGSFDTGITTLLGIDDAERQALYALDDPASSYYQALEEAGGVWCSNWDAPPVQDLDAMSAVGYDAPLEAASAYFVDHADPYGNLVDRTGIAGCTLGVP